MIKATRKWFNKVQRFFYAQTKINANRLNDKRNLNIQHKHEPWVKRLFIVI